MSVRSSTSERDGFKSPVNSIKCLSDSPSRSSRQTANTSSDRRRIVHTLETGALRLATDRVLDGLLAPCPNQGVTLQIKIILRCRNSSITTGARRVRRDPSADRSRR